MWLLIDSEETKPKCCSRNTLAGEAGQRLPQHFPLLSRSQSAKPDKGWCNTSRCPGNVGLVFIKINRFLGTISFFFRQSRKYSQARNLWWIRLNLMKFFIFEISIKFVSFDIYFCIKIRFYITVISSFGYYSADSMIFVWSVFYDGNNGF